MYTSTCVYSLFAQETYIQLTPMKEQAICKDRFVGNDRDSVVLRADIKSRIEETKILRKLKVLHVILNRTAWSRWWWHYNHQVSVRLNVTARFHVQPCMATNDIIFFKERVPTQFYFCFFNSLVWPLNIACLKQVYFVH